MMKYKIFFILLLLILFSACDTSPPVIEQFFWKLNLNVSPNGKIIEESLAVFVDIEDEDGIDDIEFLTLYSDENELFWHLPHKNSIRNGSNQTDWYGSRHIIMPDKSDLPRGHYKVRINDYSGKKDERSFFLSPVLNRDEKFSIPSISLSYNIITCSPLQRDTQIWFFNANHDLIKSISITAESIDTSLFFRNNEAAYFKVYYSDNQYGFGVIVGDFKF